MRVVIMHCIVLMTLFAANGPVDMALTDEERAWITDHPRIAFTGDPNWLPYEAFTEEGNYIGIVADHLKGIEALTGLHFDPVPVKRWTESLQIAMRGDVKVISGDAADDILNQKFKPVDAYSRNPIVIVMREDQQYLADLSAIADRNIAIIKDYGYTADIFKTYPDIINQR